MEKDKRKMTNILHPKRRSKVRCEVNWLFWAYLSGDVHCLVTKCLMTYPIDPIIGGL